MARKRKRKKTPAAPAARPARVSTSLRHAIQGWKAERESSEREDATRDGQREDATRDGPETRAPAGASPTSATPGFDRARHAAPHVPHGGTPPETPSERELDERAALAKAMEGVQPLRRGHGKRRPDASEPRSHPANHARHEAARQDALARDRLDALVGGGIRFSIERDDNYVRGRRHGSHPRVPHRLGSDTCRADARLDLHGLTSEEAKREVVRFVRAQRSRGARRVLIIHGKGNHSESGCGVLADAVIDALTEGGAAPAVEAFSTAAPANGGSGALVVQLTR